MKYKKLFGIILLTLFLSGCTNNNDDINTIYYNLNIGRIFEEKIDIYLTKDAYDLAKENEEQEESVTNLEYKLLHEDIEPIFSEHNIYYNKNIKKGSNSINVKLSYDYIEDDFIYSNYLMNCFEDYNIKSNEDTLEINLNGEFYCLHDKKQINIKVNSIFEVESTNGTLIDGFYTWNINTENVNNVNISYIISRNYDGMSKDRANTESNESNNTGWIILRSIVIFLILGLLLILYKKYKNTNE